MMFLVWLGLGTKNTWLGLGKDHGLGSNDQWKCSVYLFKVMQPSLSFYNMIEFNIHHFFIILSSSVPLIHVIMTEKMWFSAPSCAVRTQKKH